MSRNKIIQSQNIVSGFWLRPHIHVMPMPGGKTFPVETWALIQFGAPLRLALYSKSADTNKTTLILADEPLIFSPASASLLSNVNGYARMKLIPPIENGYVNRREIAFQKMPWDGDVLRVVLIMPDDNIYCVNTPIHREGTQKFRFQKNERALFNSQSMFFGIHAEQYKPLRDWD